MAKYDAHYSCGHTQEVNLVGKESERRRKLEWFAKAGTCPTCYRAKLEADRAAQTVTAKAEAQTTGLPDLDGSEKQIAWALRIRAEVLADSGNDVGTQVGVVLRAMAFAAGKLEKLRGAESLTALGLSRENVAKRKAVLQEAAETARRAIETQTSARWWIDNRETAGAAVRRAVEQVEPSVSSDISAALEAAQAEDDAASRAARAAEDAARIRAHQDKIVETEAKAESFRVSERPGCIVVERDTIRIVARDGRVATGWIMDGEWAVCRIGSTDVQSMHPMVVRIAAEARAIYENTEAR